MAFLVLSPYDLLHIRCNSFPFLRTLQKDGPRKNETNCLRPALIFQILYRPAFKSLTRPWNLFQTLPNNPHTKRNRFLAPLSLLLQPPPPPHIPWSTLLVREDSSLTLQTTWAPWKSHKTRVVLGQPLEHLLHAGSLTHLYACAATEALFTSISVHKQNLWQRVTAGRSEGTTHNRSSCQSVCRDFSSEWRLSWKTQHKQHKLSPHYQHLQALSPPLLLIQQRCKLCVTTLLIPAVVQISLYPSTTTPKEHCTYWIRSENTPPPYYRIKLKLQTQFPP